MAGIDPSHSTLIIAAKRSAVPVTTGHRRFTSVGKTRCNAVNLAQCGSHRLLPHPVAPSADAARRPGSPPPKAPESAAIAPGSTAATGCRRHPADDKSRGWAVTRDRLCAVSFVRRSAWSLSPDQSGLRPGFVHTPAERQSRGYCGAAVRHRRARPATGRRRGRSATGGWRSRRACSA